MDDFNSSRLHSIVFAAGIDCSRLFSAAKLFSYIGENFKGESCW